MTLSKFLHNSSKWDFSVKVKIWRNRKAGRPYASYSTAEATKPKQGSSENTSNDNSEQSVTEVTCLFQLQWNTNEGFARDTQKSKVSHSHRNTSADRSCGLLWVPSLCDFILPAHLSPFKTKYLQISLLPISEVAEVQSGS